MKRPFFPTIHRCGIYMECACDTQIPGEPSPPLESQERICRAVAEQCGWQVLDEFVRSDRGASGMTDGRPGLESLLGDAKRKPRPFEFIIVYDMLRLSRDAAQILNITDSLEQDGIAVYFVTDRLHSLDPQFRLLVGVRGLIDEAISQNKKRVGVTSGGRCYGYIHVPVPDADNPTGRGRDANTHVEIEINETEAAVVRRMFEMSAGGYTCRQIANTMNDENIPSPTEARSRIQTDGWGRSSVKDILQNKRYTGFTFWSKTQSQKDPESGRSQKRLRPDADIVHVNNPHWRIVSDDLWNHAHNSFRFVTVCVKKMPTRMGRFFSRVLKG